MLNPIITDIIETNDEHKIIDWLMVHDELYENDESPIDDSVYDYVYKYAKLTFSANKYFTGVGADVRGSKVQLPFNMSGLQQVYVGNVEKWVQMNIIPSQLVNTDVIVSDKLDGVSAQVIYDASGALQIAYSRGNGTEGADITRHIRQIPNIPKQLKIAPGCTLPVRMEVLIPKEKWNDVASKFTSRMGVAYKNTRNATAGIMNASENDPNIYNYMEGVAYTVMDSEKTKVEDLLWLHALGFDVVRYKVIKGTSLNDDVLTTLLNDAKKTSRYDLDGVVVNLNSNKTAFKYKVSDAETNQAMAVVKDVVWTPSKDGYLKPVIMIEPINLMGVTISKCTGFNAIFIYDNQIQPGTVIKMVRSGDVIPYCSGIVSKSTLSKEVFEKWFNDNLSAHGEWSWSQNKVDAVLIDKTANTTSMINMLVDIFNKLKVTHLGPGNIETLYNNGFNSVNSILAMDYTDWYMNIGENGVKVFESLQNRLENIYWPNLAGSLNLFGRGVGRRKLTSLYEALQGDTSKLLDVSAICNVEGFEQTTALQIANHAESALKTIEDLKTQCSYLIITEYDKNKALFGDRMVGQVVVFTGLRSEELEKEIVEQGGTIGSSVTSSTTIVCAKDPNSNSGKIKKVHDLNAKRTQLGQPLIELLTMQQLQKKLL